MGALVIMLIINNNNSLRNGRIPLPASSTPTSAIAVRGGRAVWSPPARPRMIARCLAPETRQTQTVAVGLGGSKCTNTRRDARHTSVVPFSFACNSLFDPLYITFPCCLFLFLQRLAQWCGCRGKPEVNHLIWPRSTQSRLSNEIYRQINGLPPNFKTDCQFSNSFAQRK